MLPGGTLGTYLGPDTGSWLVDRGLGSRIYDSAGREYIDFVLGSGPMLLGHAHPAVVKAVTAQAARGSQFYWMTEPALDLAELLVEAIPCATMVKFASTGAEATFYALRLARAYTGREKVVRFAGSYHGHHDFGISDPSAGIPEAVRQLTLLSRFNDLDGTEQILRAHAGEIAAVLVEPLQRTTLPRPGFLDRLRMITKELGIVLVFDEVVTGFRLAWGGAQEKYAVTPDLATYGKVLGGGYPLAALAGPPHLMELLNARVRPPNYAFASGTLNGNPVSAAAGLATLRELHAPGTYERLDRLGEYFRAGLHRLTESFPVAVRVLGEGPIAGIAFTEGDAFDPNWLAESDKKLLAALELELLRRGLFVNLSAGKLYISLAHTQEDLDLALHAFEDGLTAVGRLVAGHTIGV